MMVSVTFLPNNITISVESGTTVLEAMIRAGLHPDAPCGGRGTCGKCKVQIDGNTVLACQTQVREALIVTLPDTDAVSILETGVGTAVKADGIHEYVAAFDIGTTTLVAFLLSGKTGELLATASSINPQAQYGADVIARIEAAMGADTPVLQEAILPKLRELLTELTREAGIDQREIRLVSVVGNTAMHHLLLGIDPMPLVSPPYMPNIREAMELPAAPLLPIHPDGILRVLPNIAGFVEYRPDGWEPR